MKEKHKPAPTRAMLRKTAEKLQSKANLEQALPHFRNAVQHLVILWNELGQIEKIIGEDIEASDISTTALTVVDASCAQEITIEEFKFVLQHLGGSHE